MSLDILDTVRIDDSSIAVMVGVNTHQCTYMDCYTLIRRLMLVLCFGGIRGMIGQMIRQRRNCENIG